MGAEGETHRKLRITQKRRQRLPWCQAVGVAHRGEARGDQSGHPLRDEPPGLTRCCFLENLLGKEEAARSSGKQERSAASPAVPELHAGIN